MRSTPAPSPQGDTTGVRAAAQAVRDVLIAAATAEGAVVELDDGTLTDELVELRRLADVAEAAYMERLRVFDARGVSETTEVLSTRQWVRHHLNVAAGETRRAVKIARGLEAVPMIRSAFAAGQIRLPHAAAIVEAIELLGAEVIAACQERLIDAATKNDPSRLRAALRGLGAAVDSDKAARRARKQREGRWLDVATTFDGEVHVQGVLDAESGAIVQTAIQAYARPAGVDDTRSASRRRADALIDICTTAGAGHGNGAARRQQHARGVSGERGATGQGPVSGVHGVSGERGATGQESVSSERGVSEKRGGPSKGATDVAGPFDRSNPAMSGSGGESIARGAGPASRPSIVVVCDLTSLLAHSGGFAQLSNGDVLTGEAARRLACDAQVTRVITGPQSMPLDVGRAQRTVTPAQQRALRLRDGQCRFPGCDRLPEWCDAHHLRHWAHGGSTDLANLILLCRRHHTAVHEGGWAIRTVDGSSFKFISPDGEIVGDGREISTREIIHQLTRDRDGPPTRFDHERVA